MFVSDPLGLLSEWSSQTPALHIGEDFYIVERGALQPSIHPFKSHYTICCLCLSGTAEGHINLTPCSLEPHTLCIVPSGQILEVAAFSRNFKAFCVLMSNEFIANLGLNFNLQVHISVLDNPVISLSGRQFKAMTTYLKMVRNVLEMDHPNKAEIVRHLTCAFFYGIGYFLHKATDRPLTNEEALMHRFLDEVQRSFRSERKLGFYAERLHLSTRYLSAVVKKYSGKTADEWVDDYVILEAKALLKSTNMTIQQISNELHFASQSFFRKYFKRLTGVSPKHYRDGTE